MRPLFKKSNIFLAVALSLLGQLTFASKRSFAQEAETVSTADFAYGKILFPDAANSDSFLLITFISGLMKAEIKPDIRSFGLMPGQWMSIVPAGIPAGVDTGEIADAIVDSGRLYLLSDTGLFLLNAPYAMALQLAPISGQPSVTRLKKEGDYLYWMQGKDIYRAHASTPGAAQMIAETAAVMEEQGTNFYFSVDSQFVYWTEFNRMQVKRKANDGSGATSVIAEKFASAAGPANIELFDGQLFFSNTNGNANEDIFRMNLDGTGLEKIVTGYSGILQMSFSGNKLYFASFGTTPPTGFPMATYIHSVDLNVDPDSDVSKTEPQLIAVRSGFPAAFALTEDGSAMLWTEMLVDFEKQVHSFALKRLELDGSVAQ